MMLFLSRPDRSITLSHLLRAVGTGSVLLLTSAVFAADGWEVTTGLGVGVGPRYSGGRETVTGPVASLDIKAPMGFFLGTQTGIGWGADLGKRGSFSVFAGLSPERKDHRARFEGSDYLRGMGKIKRRGLLGFNAKVEMGIFELESTLSFTDKGDDEDYIDAQGNRATARQEGYTTLRLGLGTQFYEGVAGTLVGSVLADWGDRHYMMTWYGVNPLQASRSRFASYSPGPGLVDVGANLSWTLPINKQTSLIVNGEALRLVGDAADSPIVLRKTQLSGSTIVSYTF
ncbi:MipA/OmpV family protein [Chitinivorax sp. B]|uniref:MipA/OmpV family protein n=1 Tax=Chitinivorax sp. B TaxID=2502235 RepID=UPI001484D3AD|nr:MipA/OmpV family protein [Chitinivorax sp. B]